MAATYAPRHRRDVSVALGPTVPTRVLVAAAVLLAFGVAVAVATR